MNIPTGTVTFLFTDIEGSTKLSQKYPDTLPAALDKHHHILQRAIDANKGFVFEIVGDAFCAAFQNAEDAVRAAVDAQIDLEKENWGEVTIKVRMGIHSGKAEWTEGRYRSYLTLAQTNRLMSEAYGVQILISNDAYVLAKEKYEIENLQASIPGALNEISFRDLGERRLKDVIKPVRLFQILSKEIREDFPPLKTLDARPNNLPVRLTSFIGRKDEIKNVKNLLKQTRLLTLIGSGGAGKTRLALQVAEDVIDDFANGVWFVELAALLDPSLLLQLIMNIFGLKEEPRRSLEDTLYDYLKDKEILIILDNCEHLIEWCARLAEKLLSKCPKLKILTTTREALKCEGEQTHRVSSLEIPNPKKENSTEKLLEIESVRLFTERAMSVDGSFKVNNENAQALAEICYKLDGIPLAIELAAARIKIMSIEQIRERLNDMFNLLTGGKRTALPRQQTLRALIEWSYDLLSEEEKILWRRLSVFSGGWTLKAAEEVCSDEKIRKQYFIDLLNQLTEKSIVIFEGEKERYRILQTLRQFGKEKLVEANELENVLSRHLNYYMEFSETAEPKLNESEVQGWLNKLESEHNNFQCAIEWSIRSGNVERGARLASALGSFWNIRWHHSTGYCLLNSILKNCNKVSKTVVVKVLNWIGLLSKNRGEYEQAEAFYTKSIKLSKKIGYKPGTAISLNGLGKIVELKANLDHAQELYEESLIISREISDKSSIAVSLNGLGIVSRYKGKFEQSLKFYEESLLIRRETGDVRGIANTLHNLAMLADDQYDFDRSKKYYEESLKLRREICDKLGIEGSLNGLAKLEINHGNFEKAQKIFEESLAMKREIGDKPGIAALLSNLGIVTYYRENYEPAREYLEEALALSSEIGDKYIITAALNNLGNLEFAQNNFEKAEMYHKQSLELELEMGIKPEIANSQHNLGNVYLLNGDPENAMKYYKESLTLFIELKDTIGKINSLIGLAGVFSTSDLPLGVILLGAVDSGIKSSGIVLIKEEQKFHVQIMNMLHEKLIDEEFRKYFEVGKKMTLDEASQIAVNR